jgi:hypothetical protein
MGVLKVGSIGYGGRVERHEIGKRARLDHPSVGQAELPRRHSRHLVHRKL